MSGVGCGAVPGTGSQALQQAAPPSPGSAPLRGRCHLVLAAERKRRNTLPRLLLLLLLRLRLRLLWLLRRLRLLWLLWLLSAGPVSLIFLPGDLGWGRQGWGEGWCEAGRPASDCWSLRTAQGAGPAPAGAHS